MLLSLRKGNTSTKFKKLNVTIYPQFRHAFLAPREAMLMDRALPLKGGRELPYGLGGINQVFWPYLRCSWRNATNLAVKVSSKVHLKK